MGIEHHRITRKDGNEEINIHYVSSGKQNEKGDNTIILCHGWPDLWFGWRKQIPVLSGGGYHVVVPDMRGFGGTTAPYSLEMYTWKHITADLVFLLDSLHIKRAVFIGHDWGGMAVWFMTLYHPSRVKAVAAVCTPYTPPSLTYVPLEEIVKIRPVWYYQKYFNSDDAVKELDSETERLFLCLFRTSEKDDTVGKWMTPSSKSLLQDFQKNPSRSRLLDQDELNYYVRVYKQTGFRGGLNWYRTRELNWKEAIDLKVGKIIEQPSLMVTTGRDKVLTRELADNMGKFIPSLKKDHIEEAGHWVLVEQSDRLNRILLSWLGSLPLQSSL